MKILWVLLVIVLMATPVFAQEGRAVWLNVGNYPGTPQGIEDLVASLAQANFNMIFAQVFYHGQSIYPSQVAKDYGIVEQNPRFGGWDPLEILIKASNKYDIQIHPWIDVLYVGYQSPGAILDVYPHWATLNREGQMGHGTRGFQRYWLSAGHPEVGTYLLNMLEELVHKYPIQGVHLDYIRYPDPKVDDFGYEQWAVEAFTKELGLSPYVEPQEDPHTYSLWNKWRANQVSQLVQKLVENIKDHVAISAAVAPLGIPYEASPGLLQPWNQWSDYVDFLVPMTYNSQLKGVQGMLRFSQYKEPNVPMYAGLQLWRIPYDGFASDQVEVVRQLNASGVSFFAVPYLTQSILDELASGVFGQKAQPKFTHEQPLIQLEEPKKINLVKGETVRLDEFTLITGGELEQTVEVELSHDGQQLYIDFMVEAPVTSASVEQRDGPVFYDDSVEIFIDPRGDTGLYYHLAVNSLGTQYDAHVLDGTSWDGKWHSQTWQTEHNWGGQIIVPFSIFEEIGNQWAFNVGISVDGEFASYAPVPGIFHSPEHFARLILQ